MNKVKRINEGKIEGKDKQGKKPILIFLLAALLLLAAVGINSGNKTAPPVFAPGEHINGEDYAYGKKDITFQGAPTTDAAVVWDWADEDGDVISVDGKEIPILNTPASLPLGGKTTLVTGVRDGVGGISVAVHVPGCTPSVQFMKLQPGQTGKIFIRGN